MERHEAYVTGLRTCLTLAELSAHVLAYADIAIDAAEVVSRMSEADFPVWQAGLLKERRREFAGDAFARRFGALLMPEPMFTISMMVSQYAVPFAIAEQRLRAYRPDLFKKK